MYGGSESPGSIKNQIGRSLNAIRDAVAAQDVFLVADLTADLVANCSPKLKPVEEAALRVPELPNGRDRDGRQARNLFRACLDIRSQLLRLMSERGLYAWQDVETGDASGLALGADDEAKEAPA